MTPCMAATVTRLSSLVMALLSHHLFGVPTPRARAGDRLTHSVPTACLDVRQEMLNGFHWFESTMPSTSIVTRFCGSPDHESLLDLPDRTHPRRSWLDLAPVAYFGR
jgi:hypothetical protein